MSKPDELEALRQEIVANYKAAYFAANGLTCEVAYEGRGYVRVKAENLDPSGYKVKLVQLAAYTQTLKRRVEEKK